MAAMSPRQFVKSFGRPAHRLALESQVWCNKNGLAGGGIPSLVTLAQAVLESGWLRYPIRDRRSGKKSFNIFGVKWFRPKDGPYVEAITHEWVNGVRVLQIARFRVYKSYLDSLRDHNEFLLNNRRYRPALRCGCDDPEGFARQLQECGYATDPKYAIQLISIMRGLKPVVEEIVR